MKESFYDEVSRWSQVFGGSKNRTKTPNGCNSHSRHILHPNDQSNNTNSSHTGSNKNSSSQQALNQKNHTAEEDKEDLFLYSQGESGATFNRTENDSSFLTSEKNKINSCLRGSEEQLDMNGIIKRIETSPSFEELKELSISKTLDNRPSSIQLG